MRICGFVLAALVALGAGSAPTFAQNGGGTRLQPSGDWQLFEQDEYCRASRAFGEGRNTVSLAIDSFGPVGNYRFQLVGAALPRNESKGRIARIGFGPEDEPRPTLTINDAVRDFGSITFAVDGPRPGMSFAFLFNMRSDASQVAWVSPASDTLYVDTDESGPVELALGPMAEVMSLMADCEESLMSNWGVDPAMVEAVAVPARIENGRDVLNDIKIPRISVYNKESLFLQVRMIVGGDGEARDCVVQDPEWDRRRQRGVCDYFEQLGQYTPALDAEGQPIDSLFHVAYTMFVFD